MKLIITLSFLLSLGSFVFAAIPVKPLIGSGYIAGGEANSGVTIINIKKIKMDRGTTERYALEFGDRQGRPLIGKPGYFHVELKNKPRPQLIVNISKVVGTQVDKKKLNQILARSNFLAKSNVYQNAEDGSQSYIFDLKKNVPVRVYQVKSKSGPSKMILDIGPTHKK